MKNENILFLTTDSRIGGTEKIIISIANALKRRGYEPRLVCFLSGGDLPDILNSQGIKAFCLGIDRYSDLPKLFRLIKYARREKFKIIHSFLLSGNFANAVLKLFLNTTVTVFSERCLDLTRSNFRTTVNKIFSILCDKIVTVSESVRNVLLKREKISPEKVVVIQNGFEFSRLEDNFDATEYKTSLGLDSKSKIITSIGRLRKEKGHVFLMKAFREILQLHNNARLLIAGDGAEEESLKSAANSLGVSDKALFAGFRDDVAKLLKITDVFVLPSLEEGFPAAVIEAAFYGVPIVATEIGGTREILDNETCVFVPPADSEKLAQAVLSLLDDENKARQLGMSAKQKITGKYSLEIMVDKIESLYENILKSKNIAEAVNKVGRANSNSPKISTDIRCHRPS